MSMRKAAVEIMLVVAYLVITYLGCWWHQSTGLGGAQGINRLSIRYKMLGQASILLTVNQ